MFDERFVVGAHEADARRRPVDTCCGGANRQRRAFRSTRHPSRSSARARMIDECGAHKFDWQMLRSTCSAYLTDAQGIFGSATECEAVRHWVMLAERHYLTAHRSIPRDARTLAAAM
jgi:hypothetical protein